MNNLQNTPENMIRTINNLITTNERQTQGVTSGYNITNPSLTTSRGEIIKDKNNRVYNINNKGVATYFPSANVYDATSGQRGVLGTGDFSRDSKAMPKVSFPLNPGAVGYDKNSKLYLNRNIRRGQSTGDEMKNIFAGVKTPIKFEYKGCSMLPTDNQYKLNTGGPVSLKQCYYNALERGLSYFGLGNVNSDTAMGTCYAGNISILDKPWQNTGTPIWSIDLRKDFGYQGKDLQGIVLGRNTNVYFSLNGINTDSKYNFYELCKSGKLPNADPVNADAFNDPVSTKWGIRALFLSKGNLYIFYLPQGVSYTVDMRDNPENYPEYIAYSSGTSGKDLKVGWTWKDIATGHQNNRLFTHGGRLDSLKIGQSIYSLERNLRLSLTPDYKLVLYTGNPNVVGCTKNLLNQHVGYTGIAVNQVNNIKQNEENNFGKLAYVNRLGSAYTYNDGSLYGHHDLYTSNPGYTIRNINNNKNVTKFKDVDGFIYDNSAASIDKCKVQCSKTGSCVATVIDNNSCYLARKIDNWAVTYRDGAVMNLRVPKIYKEGQPSYTLYPDHRLPGGDLGARQANTANQCLDICNKNVKCNSVEVSRNKNGVTCFPKTFKEPTTLDRSNNADVFMKNPEVITNVNQNTYTKYPSTWVPGADLYRISAPKVKDCMKACNENKNCGVFEYWDWNGFCFLKTDKAVPRMRQQPNIGNAIYVKNSPLAGVSYLLTPNVNVVNPNKFSNYNILPAPMSKAVTDVTLMPESTTNNVLQTSSAIQRVNNKIVGNTHNLIVEPFASTRIYKNNTGDLYNLGNNFNQYIKSTPPLLTNIGTLNKMVSNSSIHMRYMNIMYSILFIALCILLVVAFTISL